MKLRVLIISLILTIAMGLFAVSLATSTTQTTQPTSINNTSTITTGTNTAASNNGIDSYVAPTSGSTGTTTLSASNDIVVESTSNINNNSKEFGFNEILNILLIAVGIVIILLAIAIMFRLK